jgi:hypothetical protein
MYEQINSQFLSLGKTFADAAVKAQGVALAGFEKIADVQLKAVEKQVNASSAFWSEASEIRDFDGAKAIWPKGVALAKESAEKLYNTNQELLGITLKTFFMAMDGRYACNAGAIAGDGHGWHAPPSPQPSPASGRGRQCRSNCRRWPWNPINR